MPEIIIEPGHIVLEVQPDETLMEAANRLGLYWPNTCGGNAECGICAYQVEGAADAIWPEVPNSEEAAGLETSPFARRGGVWRLACRSGIRGDATLLKRGVR